MAQGQWPALRSLTLPFKKRAHYFVAVLILACVLIVGTTAVRADEAATGNTPGTSPFNGTYVIHLSESTRVQSSGRPEPGYFDTLAIELFTKAGLAVEIVPQMPWKRQMELAGREVGHVIYPTTRIDHREDVFQWVGPVSRTFWNLFGFVDTGWSDMAFDTLLRDARIGVLMGSAREGYLRDRGAKQLVMVPREELLLPMMMADRVDLIAIGGNILRHYLDKVRAEYPEVSIPDVTGFKPYRTCYLYIAISGDVPQSDITRLQTQLDRFKTDGFFIENRRMHGLSTNLDSAFLKAMLDLDNNGVTCVDLTDIDT
ncbi:transporter substrate-binding domain-containing protein [Thalassospira sp. ER-Se-21-Dark]|uniref:substrate-binding periplasmic protein n=1 Tax=Thalassospira sp. ER-Se-21-Dark TaxID=2585190 RepID=UPI001B301151|nr:transporter substrate-binding domain-containing protein [Thalassospira sp. ER-Se-21-Dark]MBP3125483.1 ABC transporter substrate-binding protein [Thalassospira sp. ER-Se-21-Dark]